MNASDWIMVAAVICGPIFAVQAQKWIEIFRENKNRRINTFKRLMATRGAPLSWGHVEGLNSIELEFSGGGKKDEQVRRRWREYHDHLNSLSPDPEKQKEQLDRWTERKDELLAQLLCDMGGAVGYNFDIVQIRRGIYSPMGHANFELETQAIRKLLIDVLVGKRALPMDVRSLPAVQGSEGPRELPPPIEKSDKS